MFGHIRISNKSRHTGWLFNEANGADIFFHEDNFIGDKSLIQPGQKVTFELLDYLDKKDNPRRKAVNIKPASVRDILSAPQTDEQIHAGRELKRNKPAQTAPGTTTDSTIAAAKVLAEAPKAVKL